MMGSTGPIVTENTLRVLLLDIPHSERFKFNPEDLGKPEASVLHLVHVHLHDEAKRRMKRVMFGSCTKLNELWQ